MSKIKLTGHASGSGTLTITGPNTSSDRTITLPDGDVTLGAATPSIDDNGNATAITIDSSEQVGIGQAPTDYQLVVREPNGDKKVLELSTGDSTCRLAFSRAGDPAAYIDMKEDGATGTGGLHFGTGTSNSPTTTLKLHSDGRGLSEFTAKAWLNFDGTGTIAIRDSHNISGIVDEGVGACTVTFANTMADDNYSFSADGSLGGGAFIYNDASNTTSTCYVRTRDADGTSYVDRDAVSVIIFGG